VRVTRKRSIGVGDSARGVLLLAAL